LVRFALPWLILIPSPLAGKSGSFADDSDYFVQLLNSVNLQCLDILFSLLVSLFTNIPANEVLQVISYKLYNDDTLAERSILDVEAIGISGGLFWNRIFSGRYFLATERLYAYRALSNTHL
jgi:hypothetical protein